MISKRMKKQFEFYSTREKFQESESEHSHNCHGQAGTNISGGVCLVCVANKKIQSKNLADYLPVMLNLESRNELNYNRKVKNRHPLSKLRYRGIEIEIKDRFLPYEIYCNRENNSYCRQSGSRERGCMNSESHFCQWEAEADFLSNAIKETVKGYGLHIHKINDYCRTKPNQFRVEIKRDGSCGFEINLPPFNRKNFHFVKNILSDLRKPKLNNRRAIKVNSSCGMHIHFDISDFNLSELKSLCGWYAFCEPFLFSALPNSRQSNTYCKKWKYMVANSGSDTLRYSELLEHIDSLNSRRLKSFISSNDRYYALNLKNFTYIGTIEFRMLQGTLNAEKVKHFSNLLEALIQISIENDFFENLDNKLAVIQAGRTKAKFKRMIENLEDKALIKAFEFYKRRAEYFLRRRRRNY